MALGTRFTAYFDAPRNWDRDDWDAYTKQNPFFREWIAYNRYVVTRRVAETYREALLAGFPPEMVKCHQIPDTYAVGNLSAFSTVTSRFTPIDWELNSGAGYGFTRYGVWYKAPHEALKDAHSSGFDSMTLGEYQALTPSDEDAYGQLKFISENGGESVHCMMWPTEYDKGFNLSMDHAARRMLKEDAPRPGITGGVGQVRAYRGASAAYDIACIGTGAEHTGLLKSLKSDGGMEGSVYVVPFHSHVEVTALRPEVTGNRMVLGPFANLDSGSQIEIVLRAGAATGGTLHFAVQHGDTELPGLSQDIAIPRGGSSFRLVLRAQLPAEGIRISISAKDGTLQDIHATRQTEITPKLSRGSLAAKRHQGGVTFDILPE